MFGHSLVLRTAAGSQAPISHVGSQVHQQGGSSSSICYAGLWPTVGGSWGFHPHEHFGLQHNSWPHSLNKDTAFTPVQSSQQDLQQFHVRAALLSAECLFICQGCLRSEAKPLCWIFMVSWSMLQRFVMDVGCGLNCCCVQIVIMSIFVGDTYNC